MAHLLAAAAQKAWASVKDNPDLHSKVGQGAGGNATSRADAALEKAILAAAKRLKLTVLSEEAGLVELGGEWIAIVDPLDGSRNAGRGIPLHCTSIAIAPRKGTFRDIVAGVVINLVTGDTYEAARGKGATANGKRVKPRRFDADEVMVGVVADYASTEIDDAHRRREHHLRDLGSAALEMCLVGVGALDAFVVRQPWLRTIDIAAATIFIREAGGVVVDPATGKDFDCGYGLDLRLGVVAAHGEAALAAVSRGPAPATKPGRQTWAVVGKSSIPHVLKEARRLIAHLKKKGQTVLVEDGLGATGKGHTLDEMDKQADIFLSVGGDGTILRTLSVTDKPILGVNAGAIGFLCEVEPPQATGAIDRIIRGDFRVEDRDKLSAWLDGERLPDATNEVTLQTSRIAKLIQFSIRVAGEHLDTLRGDGIIVSTPSGSTGYAMSVGGPLVHPQLRGTVLAPIAPFRLAARPWVVPGDSTVELTLLERDSAVHDKQARVVIDGQHGFGMSHGSTVRIEPSPRKARFIRLGSGFYERVRTKLTR